jgi:MFS family permease
VISTYRRVLGIPGAVAFSAAGVLGRLPISMVSLGIVLLVSDHTGSYAIAGGVSAVYVAATAVGAVPLARLVDRLGQRTVLAPAMTLSCIALAMLMVAVEAGWPHPVPHVFAALSGLTMPNVGAAVRARWSYVVHDRALLDTAFAVEAVNDELVFILGPTAVTLLASAVHPLAGLAAAAVTALVGTWWLATQRRTEPRRHRDRDDAETSGVRHPMPWGSMWPLLFGSLALGVLFGGCEVAVVAFADEAGDRGLSGVLLATWALGSLLAGVAAGTMTFRRSASARYRLGIVALALLMVPLPFVEDIPVMAAVLFSAGFAISPTMIAAVSWVEAVVPRDRLTEGMTVFSTGLVAGVAPGAALVGAVVDTAGASASFWVPAGAGLLGALVALLPARGPVRATDAVVTVGHR